MRLDVLLGPVTELSSGLHVMVVVRTVLSPCNCRYRIIPAWPGSRHLGGYR